MIRWKLFTLDVALVLRTAGHLSVQDQAAAGEALHEVGLAVYDQSGWQASRLAEVLRVMR